MMENKLSTLEDSAISFLTELYNEYGLSMFVGTSGGKDSAVVQHLMQRVYRDVVLVHNVKGIDDSSTTSMSMSTLIHLYSYVAKNNNLILCSTEEMKTLIHKMDLKIQIDGSRSDEFLRQNKSSMIEIDGLMISRCNMPMVAHNGLFGLSIAYPIKDWTYNDVFDYHKKYNIILSSEYYNDPEYIEWKSNHV